MPSKTSKDAPTTTPAPPAAPPSELEAIRHWANYGSPTGPPMRRVLASDWTTEPFSRPQSAAWDQAVPGSEVSKIIAGLQPAQMEDKWFVYRDGPDGDGVVKVHMHRSWTGYKDVELDMQLSVTDQSKEAERVARFTRIAWETDEGRRGNASEAEAKRVALGVCRFCMLADVPVIQE